MAQDFENEANGNTSLPDQRKYPKAKNGSDNQ
jgi:hypothetical protein